MHYIHVSNILTMTTRRNFSQTQHFQFIYAKSLEAGQILFEKTHTLSTSPQDLFLFLHPKHLTDTITHHYVLSLSKPYANSSNSLSHKPLCKLTSFPIENPETPNPNNGQETQPTPIFQIAPHFTNNPPTSSRDGSLVQITRPAPMTILATQVTTKDKEPRAYVKHFFDIYSFENVGYIIKAQLMLCGIHHFFEDPKVVVTELIKEFWRTINLQTCCVAQLWSTTE